MVARPPAPPSPLPPRAAAVFAPGQALRRADRARRAAVLAVASLNTSRSRAACASLAAAVEALAVELTAHADRLREVATGGGA